MSPKWVKSEFGKHAGNHHGAATDDYSLMVMIMAALASSAVWQVDCLRTIFCTA